jgi:hypothetical protein
MFNRRNMQGWHGDQRAVVEVDDNPGSLRIRTDMFRARYFVSVAATGDDSQSTLERPLVRKLNFSNGCNPA